MDETKKLTFISRSDLRGGAAIVTYRLVEALRKEGVNARMLVCEKMSDSDFVQVCSSHRHIQYSFLKERLGVYLSNGRSRKTLFKIDPSLDGLPLWTHPWVKDADAIVLGWVNQGMLSLKGVKRLGSLGKPLIWIMHDMWNMTGICHHAGECSGYRHECGDCPLLGNKAHINDISHTTWCNKKELYDNVPIKHVAVSTWLAEKAKQSSLLRDHDIKVIPNPFPLCDTIEHEDLEVDSDNIDTDIYGEIKLNTGDFDTPEADEHECGIAFGAARLDDPIKGLPVLIKALKIISHKHPEEASRMRLVTFGETKDPTALEGIAIKHQHLGVIKGSDAIRDAYSKCNIVVSTSDFETLPGTLIEGQAYGCIPVALNHGGQKDIIEHRKTGWLAPWNNSESLRAENIAEGILWAFSHRNDNEMKVRMRESVNVKFNSKNVAQRIIEFIYAE